MLKKSTIINIKICRKCGGLIGENSLHNYCSNCIKKIEEVFDSIRNYLKEFPGATAYEIEQRIGIPVHVTNNFVRDGRLVEIPNAYLNVDCLRCGCLLLSAHHKYCPDCEIEIKKEIELAKQSLVTLERNEKMTGKMHYKTYSKR